MLLQSGEVQAEYKLRDSFSREQIGRAIYDPATISATLTQKERNDFLQWLAKEDIFTRDVLKAKDPFFDREWYRDTIANLRKVPLESLKEKPTYADYQVWKEGESVPRDETLASSHVNVKTYLGEDKNWYVTWKPLEIPDKDRKDYPTWVGEQELLQKEVDEGLRPLDERYKLGTTYQNFLKWRNPQEAAMRPLAIENQDYWSLSPNDLRRIRDREKMLELRRKPKAEGPKLSQGSGDATKSLGGTEQAAQKVAETKSAAYKVDEDQFDELIESFTSKSPSGKEPRPISMKDLQRLEQAYKSRKPNVSRDETWQRFSFQLYKFARVDFCFLHSLVKSNLSSE